MQDEPRDWTRKIAWCPHIINNRLESMATAIQVEMAGKKSTSKDPGQATGVHRTEWLDGLTMSMYEHGEVGGKMSAVGGSFTN